MPRRGTKAGAAGTGNLAFFTSRQQGLFGQFARLARHHLNPAKLLFVAADERAVAAARASLGRLRLTVPLACKLFADLAFLKVPVSFGEIERRVGEWLASVKADIGGDVLLVVDMSWGLLTNSAAANFESWMVVAEGLAARRGISVASLYNRRLLIDEHLMTALRGHPSILATSGIVANPHWLPASLLTHGTTRQQIDHWLGSLAPELATGTAPASHAAEGTDPMWLLRRSSEAPLSLGSGDRWKIRCFGRLRVYRDDGSQVNWEVAGGATRKAKTLFAYLLQKGGRGAATDELADLLWPDAQSLEAARNRLYHTVNCLRAALAPAKNAEADYVLRDGSRYVLAPPPRSWLDIATFEQLCRQAQTHIESIAHDEALLCLQAADRLYTGDLFEDIPAEYADDSERDWCWSKRYWLRDMFFKVQRDAARIHRQRQDYSAALAHCQKALAIDPLCESAHEEAMHVFLAQGRREAIDRQYKLYLGSLAHFDDRPQSAVLRQTYRRLAGQA
jgi:two-component SAPR family response regulator